MKPTAPFFKNKHNIWEKLRFLAKTGVNFISFQSYLFCIYCICFAYVFGLKYKFCGNLSKIKPSRLHLALVLGPHINIHTESNFLKPFFWAVGTSKQISQYPPTYVVYLGEKVKCYRTKCNDKTSLFARVLCQYRNATS